MAKISSIEAGNAFLLGFMTRFNARFAVAPARPDDLHRHRHGERRLQPAGGVEEDAALGRSYPGPPGVDVPQGGGGQSGGSADEVVES